LEWWRGRWCFLSSDCWARSGASNSGTHPFQRFLAPLFRGSPHFKSPAIQADAYLLSCGRYIERNPLGPGLVTLPWQYDWSSCRTYALGEADDLLNIHPYYLELHSEPAGRQQRWREFLLGPDAKEEAVRRQD
jgi:hypothetical protein